MAKDDAVKKWSMEQLRGIVSAGMPISEARMLLEDGYQPEDVLELAQLQAEQRKNDQASAASSAAKVAADHTEKLHNPSNKIHPGKSDLSYPEGDTKRPRPVIPYEFLYNGYPMHKFPETQHWRELELALLVRPGEYKVIRKDYSEMSVAVSAEKDLNDGFSKMEVRFTVSREDKDKIPAITVLLYQIAFANTGKPQRRLYLEAMSEWLRITLGDDAAVEAVAV